MRGSDNDNRTATRDFPGSSRVHLAEEEVDEHRKGPEHQIVQPPNEGWDFCLLLAHGAVFALVNGSRRLKWA